MLKFFSGSTMVMLGTLSLDFSTVYTNIEHYINHLLLLIIIFAGLWRCLSSEWFLEHFN